jgi:hypothetical protein
MPSIRDMRTSLRRSLTGSLSLRSRSMSRTSSYNSATTSRSPSGASSPILSVSKSIQDLEEERRLWAGGLEMLEPRPVVFWGGLEERMGFC